jgi:hypothetical protein
MEARRAVFLPRIAKEDLNGVSHRNCNFFLRAAGSPVLNAKSITILHFLILLQNFMPFKNP